jgi:hypothetical protein
MAWDVFISHASEDKSAFVRPLAEELQRAKITVWYDEFSLILGDSLRESIDRGIADSRLGVVILSRNFFRKNWPRNELNGLLSLATSQGKRLIPIWLDVSAAEVSNYSPMLADRVALRVEQGVTTVASVVEEIGRLVGAEQPRPAAKGVPVPIPQQLVESVRGGNCILALGPLVATPSPDGSLYRYMHAPETGAELSRRLAQESDYPGVDSTRLDEVASWAEAFFGRRKLVSAMAKGMTGSDIAPSPLHKILAALPFPVVITTNYDHLFDDALRRAQTLEGTPKEPVIDVYHTHSRTSSSSAEKYEEPSEHRPHLIKIFGDIDQPETVVVTPEDHVRLTTRVGKAVTNYRDPINSYLRWHFTRDERLIIGYHQPPDYGIRVFFGSLEMQADPANLLDSYFVDPSPGASRARSRNLIPENPWDFVPSLYAEVTGSEYVL